MTKTCHFILAFKYLVEVKHLINVKQNTRWAEKKMNNILKEVVSGLEVIRVIKEVLTWKED